MKRITLEETHHYVELTEDDPYRIRKAVAYTLTPCDEPGWEGLMVYNTLPRALAAYLISFFDSTLSLLALVQPVS